MKENDFLTRDKDKLVPIKASGTGNGINDEFDTGIKRDDIVLNPICKRCNYIFKDKVQYCPNCGNIVYM